MAFATFETTDLARRSLLRGGAMLGAGAALGSVPLASALAQNAAPGALRWDGVRQMVDRYVDQRKVANMVALLGWKQQAPTAVAKGTLTLGAPVPADRDSLYRIYSMTKPITGMAAMILIDEGKMGLDQPLAEILPAFKNMMVQKTYDGSITDLEPAKRPITIRHLLTHTAGLGYSIIQKGPISQAYVNAGLVPGQVTNLPLLKDLFGRGATVSSLAAFADGLAKMPLVYQPGTRWSYSVGLDLMGRVIEVVSKQTFDKFLQQRFFGPLGMTSTFFRVPASEAARMTTNYGVMGSNIIPLDPARRSIFMDAPAFPMGGAGLVSSPRDYDRFLQMLVGYGMFGGKRVMSERAVRVGTSNLLPAGVPPTKGMLAVEAFGAGGFVGTGERAGAYGWGGAAGTLAFCDMRTGLRASLFTQFMPAEAYPVNEDFRAAVARDLMALAKAA